MFRNLLLISLMFCAGTALGQDTDSPDPFIDSWNGHFAHGEMVTLSSIVFSVENPDSVIIAIGNHPDPSECTLWETQAVREWGRGSASFRVDADAFSPGDQVYVYLMGEEGATTGGYAVILGDQGSPPESPGQPGQPSVKLD